MILIDLEDVRLIHSWGDFNKEAFIEYRFTHEEMNRFAEEDPNWLDDPNWYEKHPNMKYYPGPYLLRVNDEYAWLSRDGDLWERAVQRFRYASVEQRMWMAYLALYAEAIGVSTRTLLNRFAGMRTRLKKDLDVWYEWETIYPWPEGADEVWDGLYEHPWLETREREKKEIRYVRR